jgi:hypothetical protein
MISITCTNCQSVLTIDDAFAGGVCRCQFCGTIQTVPSKAQAALHATGVGAAKSLYQKESAPPRAEASGTGLEDLAGAVAGSGIAGSGLARQESDPADPDGAVSAPIIQAQPPATGTRLSVILITAAVVVFSGIAIFILLSGATTGRNPAKTTGSGAAALTGPGFCGIPLTGNSVVFLLDRGNSINASFDTVKAACYKSLKQLGPDRKFQVILWDNDAGSAEFPAGAMRNATAGAIEDCQRNFQDIVAGGSSHLAGPLHEALGRHPQFIVIATAKSQLDDDDNDALRGTVGSGSHVCIIQIGATPNPLFDEIAKSTAGQSKLVTPDELRDSSR